MYNSTELEFLTSLEKKHPEIYATLLSIMDKHDEEVRVASHDLRNIIALISGNYQLTALSHPELAEDSHFVQIYSDINDLTQASIDLKSRLKMNPR